MEINAVNRAVTLGGKEVRLTAKEFDLLQLFVTNRGKVFSREAMLEIVWKYDYPGDARTVDVHIRRLREKIERNPAQPEFIFTKWGVGYYFTDKIKNPFSSIRWKYLLAFLLIVVVSYFAVAASVIGLVGEYLFDDRRIQDQAATEKVAVVVAPLYLSANIDALQTLLEETGGEMGGRLMVLDQSGKVQADSYSELNGKRLELPEVATVLLHEKTVDFGVHGLDPERNLTILSYFRSVEGLEDDWVAYCSAAITSDGETIGVLLYSSSVGD